MFSDHRNRESAVFLFYSSVSLKTSQLGNDGFGQFDDFSSHNFRALNFKDLPARCFLNPTFKQNEFACHMFNATSAVSAAFDMTKHLEFSNLKGKFVNDNNVLSFFSIPHHDEKKF